MEEGGGWGKIEGEGEVFREVGWDGKKSEKGKKIDGGNYVVMEKSDKCIMWKDDFDVVQELMCERKGKGIIS